MAGLTQPPAAVLGGARLLPVVAVPDAETAVALGTLLIEEGLPFIEITFRTAAARDAIAAVRARLPGVRVAAGTILTPTQVHAAVDAGAQLLLAPGYDPESIRAAAERGVPFVPGVLSPTEAGCARAAGLRLLKLFPAALGGMAHLRALGSVFPDLAFIATGGIDASSMAGFLAEPNVAACGGSWLAPPQLLETRAFDEIRARVRQAVGILGARPQAAP